MSHAWTTRPDRERTADKPGLHKAPAPVLGPERIQRFSFSGSVSGFAEVATAASDLVADVADAVGLGPAQVLVEDHQEPGPGQLQRSAFLERLRPHVMSVCDAELQAVGQTAEGCPYLQRAFSRVEDAPAAHVERLARRYTRSGASDAEALLTAMTERAGSAVRQWVAQGAPDIPDASVDRLMLKANPTGAGPTAAAPSASPAAVRSSLGAGRPLDAGMRARLEPAFQSQLDHVRVHDDANAARLARDMDARAFTVGAHVAFGSGEYQPGTPMGDALLAHEVAHTLQQQRYSGAGATDAELEHDADSAAIHAAAHLHGDDSVRGLMGRGYSPGAFTGLRLSRCGKPDLGEKKSAHTIEVERLAGLQRGHLEQEVRDKETAALEAKRKKQVEELQKKGVADAESKVPKVDPKDIKIDGESVRDQLQDTVNKGTPPKKPTARWDAIADKPAYLTAARATLASLLVAAKADAKFKDLQTLLEGQAPEITEESIKKCLTRGWYAYHSGSKFLVSMSFIDHVKIDARNVFPIVAHEIGGHAEHKNFQAEIADEMLDGLDKSLRDSLVGDDDKRQDFFMTYKYQTTEIYSAVRQRRYEVGISGFTPQHGAITAAKNIPLRLQQIKDRWHPDVARAILVDLLKQLVANKEIRDEDITFLSGQIKKVMGYSLTVPARP